jgi:hypothetical protein
MAAELPLTSHHSEEDPSGPSMREDDNDVPYLEQTPAVSRSLAASSDIVQALFGESVGSSWGDFFCTHNRIRGRLFATSQAVFFYSNLLGFERRLSLKFQDIVEMTLYRSTSIRVTTVDCETYTFKSFHHRKHVLQLLRGLKILADRDSQQNRWPSQNRLPDQSTGCDGQLALPSLISSPSLTLPSISGQPPAMPTGSNRRRAVSDSFLRPPQEGSQVSLSLEQMETAESDAGEDSFIEESDFSLKDAWNDARKPKDPPLHEVGIESLCLSCSLDTFFQQFLADNAPYSLLRYQSDYIKDQDVNITPWSIDQDGNYTRTLTFTHPIKNSFGLGPSSAHTTRRQLLRRFRGYGICLENTTRIGGIPSADAFYVQDHWVIEADGDYRVKLQVRFDTRFTKLALFKAIIEKSVRRETKEWLIGYTAMLQEALMDESTKVSLAGTEESTRDDADTLCALQAMDKTLTRFAIVIVAILSLILLVAFLQLLSMREAIYLLRIQAAAAPVKDATLIMDELEL